MRTGICPFCGKRVDKFIMYRGDVVGCRFCGIHTKQTNYDRIRAMSVGEMAQFMNCGACPPGKDVSEFCHDEDGGSVPDMCNLCWFNWLKQEASE